MPAIDSSLLDILRCPKTGKRLMVDGELIYNENRTCQYEFNNGVPDLFSPPERLQIDLPWIEPWDDIIQINFEPPEPMNAGDIPPDLDPHKAAVIGADGNGRRVLEVGCGERKSEPFFLARGFEYIATDVDFRGRGPDIRCDAHNLPFEDESFDVYYSRAVYEHLMCPLLALSEAARVLKPGGTLICSGSYIYGFHDVASFFHCSHAAWITMLRSVGFENIRIWPGWSYTESVPSWCFRGLFGKPWYWATRILLSVAEYTYTRLFNFARSLIAKPPHDLNRRKGYMAGGLNVAASKPVH